MGILNGLVFGQLICGGVITTFALGLFGNQVYFIVLSIVGVMAFVLCRFCLDPLAD
jgi:hypothetical protein